MIEGGVSALPEQHTSAIGTPSPVNPLDSIPNFPDCCLHHVLHTAKSTSWPRTHEKAPDCPYALHVARSDIPRHPKKISVHQYYQRPICRIIMRPRCPRKSNCASKFPAIQRCWPPAI